MSEQNEEQQADAAVVRDATVGHQAAEGPERHGPSPRAGWRERVYGIKGVAAVAVAGLIVGGGAGAAIHAATADDGGRDGRPGFMRNGGRDGGGFGGPGGQVPVPGQMQQPPGGMPAQPPGMPQQPATPPEDGVSPDSSGDTTSGNNT